MFYFNSLETMMNDNVLAEYVETKMTRGTILAMLPMHSIIVWVWE
jgi:hypothetical protein